MSIIVRSSDGRLNSREIRAGGARPSKPKYNWIGAFVFYDNDLSEDHNWIRIVAEKWRGAGVGFIGGPGLVTYAKVLRDTPSFPQTGVLQLKINSRTSVEMSYAGLALAETDMPFPLDGPWYVAIVHKESGSGFDPDMDIPYVALDDFEAIGDATISDNFNRADGTLFTDPPTLWIDYNDNEPSSGLQVDNNHVFAQDRQGGDRSWAAYWELPQSGEPFTVNLDINSQKAVGNDDTWNAEIRIYNSTPDVNLRGWPFRFF